jgi:hypothetical protein
MIRSDSTKPWPVLGDGGFPRRTPARGKAGTFNWISGNSVLNITDNTPGNVMGIRLCQSECVKLYNVMEGTIKRDWEVQF